MKTLNNLMKFCLTGFALVFLFAGTISYALDIEEGGDAIFYQLRAAKQVVIAKLERKDKDFFDFSRVANLYREVQTQFRVSVTDSFASDAEISVGRTYLLYLHELRDKPGTYSLVASIYSIQPVNVTEFRDYRDVIGDYVKFGNDPVALKQALFRNFDHKVPYIQYSAAMDLSVRRLLVKEDADHLAALLSAGKIVNPRARVALIEHLGRFETVRHASVLEHIAKNSREPVSVRSASLDALYQMKAVDTLKNLVKVIDADQSLKLKRKLREIGNRSR